MATATAQSASRTLAQEIGKRHPFEHPAEEAYLNLIRTAAVLAAEFDRLFKAHGLSEPTYNILRILRGEGEPGTCCGVIGKRLVAQVPDVTRLIDRLVARDLVRRTRSESDRRYVNLTITKKGLDLLAKLDEPLLQLNRHQLRHMTKAELTQLNELLVKARYPEPTR